MNVSFLSVDPAVPPAVPLLKNINHIAHVMYINLAARVDRKEHVETQLRSIGISPEVITRFDAIRLTNAALGCSMSHLKCMEIAKANHFAEVMIVEDDITFLNPPLFVRQMNAFLSKHTVWDVVLLAGNNFPPFLAIDNTCVQVSRCQTTTGYLVREEYFDTLIDNFKTGIKEFIQNQTLVSMFAIDQFWFHLQRAHNWFLIIPLTVTQRENDYSDIEKCVINYSSLMTDLTKTSMK